MSEHEPVAWRIVTATGGVVYDESNPYDKYSRGWLDACKSITPLYAHPPADEAMSETKKETL